MEGGGARGALVAAAVEAGLRAWRAGESVQAALQAAGYAQYVVDGVVSYISGSSEAELGSYSSQPVTTTSSQHISPMKRSSGSGGVVKRARTRKEPTKIAVPVKRYVQRCMKRILEDKHCYPVASVTPATTGTVISAQLYDIQQGTQVLDRTGNMVHTKQFERREVLYDTAPNQIRVIWFWDRQCNGALPAVGDVLLVANWNSVYNSTNVVGCGGKRFEIISDRTYVINPTVSAQQQTVHHHATVRKEKVITYNATAGAITDLVSYNLVAVVICQNSSVNASYLMRGDVCFTDN